jgi:Na+/pantothenate symporter
MKLKVTVASCYIVGPKIAIFSKEEAAVTQKQVYKELCDNGNSNWLMYIMLFLVILREN